jgi:hypothetical protein
VTQEDGMTESTGGTGPQDDGSHASVGEDPAQAGGGRTESETQVDEDMGSTDTE